MSESMEELAAEKSASLSGKIKFKQIKLKYNVICSLGWIPNNP